MKRFAWGIVLVLVAVIGYAAAGPYLAIADIKTGIAEKDAEKLREDVDFPLLRQNLKEQLKAAALKTAAKELQNNPLGALAAGLATTLVDRVVDSFVTPSGLASIMEGHEPSENSAGNKGNVSRPKKDDLFRNANYSYDSFSQFSVWVPNDRGEQFRFILERRHLSWKLVNLVLPIGQGG